MTPLEFNFISPKLILKNELLNIPGFMIAESKSNIDKIILEDILDLKVNFSE